MAAVPIEGFEAGPILLPGAGVERFRRSQPDDRLQLRNRESQGAGELQRSHARPARPPPGSRRPWRRDARAEEQFLPEFDDLLHVVALRQPDLIAVPGRQHDDPGELVVVEILREDEPRPGADALGHGQPHGRVDVARSKLEVASAELHRVEPHQLARQAEQIRRGCPQDELLGVVASRASRVGCPPGDEQRLHIALTERRVRRVGGFQVRHGALRPQRHRVVAHARLSDQPRGGIAGAGKRQPALGQPERASEQAQPSFVDHVQRPKRGQALQETPGTSSWAPGPGARRCSR